MAGVLELGTSVDENDDMLKTGYPTYGTPLLSATKTGKTEAVRFLLERGTNVMKPGYDGLTPLGVVRMECCGGRDDPCRVQGREIVSEIRHLIKTAAQKDVERDGDVCDTNPGERGVVDGRRSIVKNLKKRLGEILTKRDSQEHTSEKKT